MNEHNDINLPADFDDLSKHAPMLEKLRGKGDGFAVPENYFSESLELIEAKTVLPEKDGFAVPENYFEDSVELPVVDLRLMVGNDKNSGFTVPENYFEELAERIIAIVSLSDIENPFTVPENYFEKLTDEIAALANISSLKNPEAFEVPAGYFSELDETLNTTLALDNLKQDEGFAVPDGYFGKLGDSILSRIAMQEMHSGSDADVPNGYFDTLADRISARIAEEESNASTVPLNDDKKKKIAERGRIIVFAEVLKRYARPLSVAASVALVIGVSIWFFNRSNGGNAEQDNIANNTAQSKHQLQIQPVIPQQKKDSVIPQQQIAVVKTEKHNYHKSVNLSHDAVVKVEKKDIMEQADLLDESSLADAVSAQNSTIKNPDDKFLNQSMKDYLLNDNADPGAYINNDK